MTEHTDTEVLVLSMHTAQAYVTEALANGAKGYIFKHSMPSELISGIRRVGLGQAYFSPEIQKASTFGGTTRRGQKRPVVDPLSTLTRREKIILQLAAEGHNNTQIGKQLSLSPRTVESHRASLMSKLKLRSQTDIVRFAVRKNLISI